MPKMIEFMEHTLKDLHNGNQSNQRIKKLEFQIALILKLMFECNFRIGNEIGEKEYQSYGLTTLKSKHIQIKDNDQLKIEFIGKKGVENICELCNPQLHKIMSAFKRNKNNGDGSVFTIKAIEFNDFLKEKFDCTSKDIRSWMANMLFLYYLADNIHHMHSKERSELIPANKTSNKDKRRMERVRKNIMKDAIERTAVRLHHTPAICKKSYLFEPILNRFLLQPNEELMEDLLKIPLKKNSNRRMSSVSTVSRRNEQGQNVIIPNEKNKKELFSTAVVYKNDTVAELFKKIVTQPCKRIPSVNHLNKFKLSKSVLKAY
jgi:DNA topoisomerase-1